MLEETSTDQRPPSFAEQSVQLFSDHSLRIGVSLWIAAIACLILYANGVMHSDPGRFTMIESWLIGLGCIGVPILPMRLLGRYLNPLTCIVASGCLFAGAAVFTSIIISGMLPLSPIVSTFVLIIPEALAIHAANAAIVLVREQRIQREAHKMQRSKYSANLSRLKTEHGEELARLNEAHSSELTLLSEQYAAQIASLRTQHAEQVASLRRESALDIEAAHVAGLIRGLERGRKDKESAVEALLRGPRSLIEETCAALHAELAARDEVELPGQSSPGLPLRLVTDAAEERRDRASGN